MLHQRYPPQMLKLLPRSKWHPYPTVQERAPWESLPATVRQAHLIRGEAAQQREWPVLLARRYLDFARNGDRERYQRPYFARRGMLAWLTIAECVEGRGRFLDDIMDGIWLICEESTWCVPAHTRRQRAGIGLPDVTEPTVALFSAETAALLAWVDYLLNDRLDAISPLIRRRIRHEVDARILTPFLERDDFGWMGFVGGWVNNWNPWINSNVLTCTLLLEQDETRRKNTVSKCMRCLDNFIDTYPADGGCDEGPGYWNRAGASLLDCLELLHSATGGQVDVYDEPLIKEIGRYIYRVRIADDYFVNFADAPAVLLLGPWNVFRYGQRIGDKGLIGLGAWLARRHGLLYERAEERMPVQTPRLASLGRLLPTLFHLEEMFAADPIPPLPRDVWFPGIQVMVARDREGTSEGLFVAAKGGHNAESHNHNDVGTFIVYVNGRPLIVDAGVETYRRQTFDIERYTIWTMQSAYHTLLPTVDGVMQAPGREFAARDVHYEADDERAGLTLDIAGAYPPEAGVISWRRTITLERGRGVVVTDTYELRHPVNEIVLGVLTPCKVDIGTAGKVRFDEGTMAHGRPTGHGSLRYDPTAFSVAVERIRITDARLGNIWGDHLNRVLFRAISPAQRASWTFEVSP